MEHWDRAKLVRLIPEASDYDWVSDLTPMGWIFHAGTPGQAVAYANLFWPPFMEHEGCIIRAESFEPENFKTWMNSTNGERQSVESLLNHVHILDIFGSENAALTLDQVLYLGHLLKSTWSAKLKVEYPDKEFTVTFYEDEQMDLVNYQVTFFQTKENALTASRVTRQSRAP